MIWRQNAWRLLPTGATPSPYPLTCLPVGAYLLVLFCQSLVNVFKSLSTGDLALEELSTQGISTGGLALGVLSTQGLAQTSMRLLPSHKTPRPQMS